MLTPKLRRSALAATLLAAVMGTVAAPAALAAPFCPAGQPPSFQLGFARLQQQLGAVVGEPLECQHGSPENNDVIQHTTTGLLYYRPGINTPIFTNGHEHFAITRQGLVFWRNASVVPPQPTVQEQSYLAVTRSTMADASDLLGQIDVALRHGNAGNLDAMSVEDLGAILDQLTTARDDLRNADESSRLARYDAMLVESLDLAAEAAETVLRARLTELPDARAAFLADAAQDVSESRRLTGEAGNAYSLVLPVVVG
jgi:hypothetical protein